MCPTLHFLTRPHERTQHSMQQQQHFNGSVLIFESVENERRRSSRICCLCRLLLWHNFVIAAVDAGTQLLGCWRWIQPRPFAVALVSAFLPPFFIYIFIRHLVAVEILIARCARHHTLVDDATRFHFIIANARALTFIIFCFCDPHHQVLGPLSSSHRHWFLRSLWEYRSKFPQFFAVKKMFWHCWCHVTGLYELFFLRGFFGFWKKKYMGK